MQCHVRKLLLCIFQFNPVESKKYQHDMSADPLVPIHKGMVTDQAKAKLCRF